jgi:hypothetical protein
MKKILWWIIDPFLHFLPPSLRMEPDPILMKAADIMERKGLCQGTLHNAKGQTCTFNAIRLAEGHNIGDIRRDISPAVCKAAKLAGKELTKLRGGEYRKVDHSNICSWNNVEGRTTEQAADFLRRAART